MLDVMRKNYSNTNSNINARLTAITNDLELLNKDTQLAKEKLLTKQVLVLVVDK